MDEKTYGDIDAQLLKLYAHDEAELARTAYMRALMDNIVANPYITAGSIGTVADAWATAGTQFGHRHTPSIADEVATAKVAGAAAERARLIAAVEALRPMEEPYSRRDWAIEQRGEKRMFAKILAALQGPDKKEAAE